MIEDTTDNNQQSANPNPDPTPLGAPHQTSGVNRTEIPARNTNQTADKTKADLGMERLAALGIIVAAITGVFIYSQFRALVDQNQILSSQAISAAASSVIQELNTRKQLKSAQDQIQGTEKTISTMHEQMRLDQRAWVSCVGTGLEKIEVGKPIVFTTSLANSGKTIAKKVIANFHIRFSPTLIESIPSPKNAQTFPNSSVGILVPAGASQQRYISKHTWVFKANDVDKTRIEGDSVVSG